MLNDFVLVLIYVSGFRFCAQCAGDSLCEDSLASFEFLIEAGGFSLILGAELFCCLGQRGNS